ncbi:hypothetical protein EQG64_27920 [Streptomyces sp. S6]|nr:hypothetical protein EQG64_27920 [Streptomyces sp. S6]
MASPGTGTGTDAPLTVIVAENLPPAAEGSPEAAALLDGAGVDRAVVLGPPGGGDAALPERGAVELTREAPAPRCRSARSPDRSSRGARTRRWTRRSPARTCCCRSPTRLVCCRL